ncbi:MFS general substrate transporter [Calocera viscosa TUFC12733]|uniref:MFS general substrate transporter n=1 Tax=Calocera viscosa (strain TUFC12733) TaxID=1330018 RepID=A0A167FX58_CALVF|nr:MFS general substrate transporter [Calocera viscosa TUFC12733]
MQASLRVKLAFTSLCVLATAVCNGSIFIFPLLAPSIALRLHVEQIELTNVALGGLMGQYLVAVVVGMIMDRFGTWACSLCSAVLYVVGYGGMECILQTYSDLSTPHIAIRWLILFNFLAGVGTVSSYFGFLFASSKNFPGATGLATGLPLSIFGLSPLFLSMIASTFFLDSVTGLLDSTRFLVFLAALLGSVNILGSIGLRIWPRDDDMGKDTAPATTSEDPVATNADIGDDHTVDENTPLVASAPEPVEIEPHQPLPNLLSDGHFWSFILIIAIATGTCEMVMANIGTIVQALMPDSQLHVPPGAHGVLASVGSPSTALSVRQLHVRLISVFNTVSRIGSGLLADRITAPPSAGPRRLSRLIFVTVSGAVLGAAFAWTAWGLRTEKSLWVLSTATGAGYGTVFTVTPTITATVWGNRNLGRNWGIISYAPLIGTPIFTFLYTAISKQVGAGKTCVGTACFSATFAACTISSLCAAVVSFVLTRRWRKVL